MPATPAAPASRADSFTIEPEAETPVPARERRAPGRAARPPDRRGDAHVHPRRKGRRRSSSSTSTRRTSASTSTACGRAAADIPSQTLLEPLPLHAGRERCRRAAAVRQRARGARLSRSSRSAAATYILRGVPAQLDAADALPALEEICAQLRHGARHGRAVRSATRCSRPWRARPPIKAGWPDRTRGAAASGGRGVRGRGEILPARPPRRRDAHAPGAGQALQAHCLRSDGRRDKRGDAKLPVSLHSFVYL